MPGAVCPREAELDTIPVIINASAGLGYSPEWTERLTRRFAAEGMAARVMLAASGAEIIALARQALADGARLVVAGGGDGTINAVASVLVDSGLADVRFGVLPLGTLNHFAKDLGLPLGLGAAIATVVHGVPRKVDVGEVNGRIFLNNSSLGIYPDVVRDRERQQRRLGRGKWPAFGWAVLTALRRFPFLNVRLRLNGCQHARRTPFVFVGNNEYRMQGWNIGVRERLDGAALSLYVAQRPTRFGLLKLAVLALFGRLRQARDFDMLQACEIEISTHHRRIRVATDGEVNRMQTPLHYRSRPAALTVLVPASTQGA